MARENHHIEEYEKEIIRLCEEEKTLRAIGENLDSVTSICEFLKKIQSKNKTDTTRMAVSVRC